MPPFPNLPFVPPEYPTQFIAVGYLFGKFDPLPDQPPNGAVKGWLQLKGGIKLEALIPWRFWHKLEQSPSFSLENAYLWRVYPRTTKEGNMGLLSLVKPIPLEGKTTLHHSPPTESGADLFLIRGRIAFVNEKQVVVRMERNIQPPSGKANTYLWKPFLLTLQGSLPQQAHKEQFWEILCSRKEASLSIEQAHQVSKQQITIIPKKSQSKTQKKSTSVPVIMVTGRKPEITVKFTERPNLPEQGKKVILQVTGDNGVVVKAEFNRKTLQKQVERMDSLADWVAALSGKIALVSPEGVIELEGAGVTVFEKKQKVAQEFESQKTQTEQKVEAGVTESQGMQPELVQAHEQVTVGQNSQERSKRVFRLIK